MTRTKGLTIGAAARASGLSVDTIRFYEAKGVVPAPPRRESGYREYGEQDVRRLRLAHNARRLGLSLEEVAALVARAFDAECAEYTRDVLDLVRQQAARVAEEMARLEELRADLADLERRVLAGCDPADLGCTCSATTSHVAGCACCPLIDDDPAPRARAHTTPPGRR